jgi:hypothetical protein
MLNKVDTFIKNLEKKDKIIDYLKNIYKVEVGEDAFIPGPYIDANYLEIEKDEELNKNESQKYASFEEKVKSLNLPSINDKNLKLKIAKSKKTKDSKFLIYHLDLSEYSNKGINLYLFKTVMDGIKMFKSVEDINLKKNNLDDSYADHICELFTIENMKRIDISFNNFTKVSAKKFSNALKNSTKLEYLDMAYNPFSLDEISCSNLCSVIKANDKLFHFGLSDSTRDSALKILTYRPDLKSLNLDDSRYKYKAFEYLSKCLIDKKYSLAILSLKFNTIELFAASYIEKALRLNKTLVYLNLYSTGLSDLAGVKIINGLEQNRTLIDLNLGKNRLANGFCSGLNRFFKLNNILNKLNISKNYLISNEDFSFILEGLVNNQNIISLGDLSELKIGVKIRESAEIILELNKKYSDGGKINEFLNSDTLNSFQELNKSLKINFFKSSLDQEGMDKVRRQSLDFEKEKILDKPIKTSNYENYDPYQDIITKYEINLKEDIYKINFFNY